MTCDTNNSLFNSNDNWRLSTVPIVSKCAPPTKKKKRPDVSVRAPG